MSPHRLTAHEILDLFKSSEVTPQEVFEDVLARVKAVDDKVHAYIRPAQKPSFAAGPAIGGAGAFPIPIGIKDNLCTIGEEITCGSRILKGFRPPYDAAVVEKVRRCGGLIVGIANMDEFAFGSSTESSCYGPTFNPWDLSRVPGGSSGGSAACVAADEAVWALG